MSTCDERQKAFFKYGGDAADKLVRDNAELFLSINERAAFEAVSALTRLREDIEPPTSVEQAYEVLSRLLGECLRDGIIKVPDYGLSTLGRNEYNALIVLTSSEARQPKTPEELYADVVQLYKHDVAAFNQNRKDDPDFVRRSDEALAAGLLRWRMSNQ